MPAYGNPVVGYIRPPGSPLSVGSFRVTSTFAEHVASGRGPGVDLGDGQCGAPVFALADGTVTLSGLLGTAKVVRILHAGGYESGYAHLASILPAAAKGKLVKRGQQIGTLGATGASACHLHLGMKLNGVEVDSWPLLEQVQQEGQHLAVAIANCAADNTGLKARLASIAKIATG